MFSKRFSEHQNVLVRYPYYNNYLLPAIQHRRLFFLSQRTTNPITPFSRHGVNTIVTSSDVLLLFLLLRRYKTIINTSILIISPTTAGPLNRPRRRSDRCTPETTSTTGHMDRRPSIRRAAAVVPWPRVCRSSGAK